MNNVITGVFQGVYWDSLVADLTSNKPSYNSVLDVLQETKSSIEGIFKGSLEASDIQKIIDIDHIKTQIEAKSLDLADCVSIIGGIIGEPCFLPTLNQFSRKVLN